MKHPDERSTLPLYVKTDEHMPWPGDPVFYVLSRTGLFLCRNHRFFRSSVPARTWPAELASHPAYLTLRYPRMSRPQIERVVGFFARIADLYGSEAAVLLLWDDRARRLSLHVPPQTASVSRTWLGRRYPVDVRYEQPLDLPDHVTIVGDVHSHANEPAYASATDRSDESHKAGLHVVVGKLYREPPELHCEIVVDGTRFEVDPAEVIEGYDARCESVPKAWIDKVEVDVLGPVSASTREPGRGGNDGNGSYGRDGGWVGYGGDDRSRSSGGYSNHAEPGAHGEDRGTDGHHGKNPSADGLRDHDGRGDQGPPGVRKGDAHEHGKGSRARRSQDAIP